MQHFEFRTDLDGQVSVCTSCDSESKVLKKGVKTRDLIAAPPSTLLCPGGITRDRAQYLYSKHVWPPYKDIPPS